MQENASARGNLWLFGWTRRSVSSRPNHRPCAFLLDAKDDACAQSGDTVRPGALSRPTPVHVHGVSYASPNSRPKTTRRLDVYARRMSLCAMHQVECLNGDCAMRVAQILPALNDGGVERSTVDMARHLSSRGIENWVVSSGGRLVPQITDAGSTHVMMDVGSKLPFGVRRAARQLADFADENKISIMHARSRAPAWAAWFACRKAKGHPAFITTFHGLYGHGSAVKRWYNRVMLRGPLVIANSKFIAAHIASIYGHPSARIHVAQRGVDVEKFSPGAATNEQKHQIRASFGAEDGPLLMMVAHVSRWKGHSVVIEALEALADRPWTMVFLGGHDSPNLRDELIVLKNSEIRASRISCENL
ncbi:MAG: glycosyltransferase [Rhodobacteraceae bacterium]|nr:glycosyltransferase [Paracoccaceae bacterium]